MEAVRAITEKTKGALETYNDTLLGAKQVAKASFEEMAASIGTTITPAYKELLNEYIIPSIKYWKDMIDLANKNAIPEGIKKQTEAVHELRKEYIELVARTQTYAEMGEAMRVPFDPFGKGLSPAAYKDYLEKQKTAALNAYINGQKELADLKAGKTNPGGGVGAAPEKPEIKEKDDTESNNKMMEEAIKVTEFQDAQNQEMIDSHIEMVAMMNEEDTKRADSVANSLNKIKELTSSHTKELFEIGKAATIASIMLDTTKAIMKTMAEVPPPFNIVESVAIGAMGAVQLADASNVQFNAKGAASGVLDWRAPSNNEHMVTTIGNGESILNADQTKQLMSNSNNTNSNMALHVNINSNGLDNAKEITKQQILPAIKEFLIQERGGNMVDAVGNPNF